MNRRKIPRQLEEHVEQRLSQWYAALMEIADLGTLAHSPKHGFSLPQDLLVFSIDGAILAHDALSKRKYTQAREFFAEASESLRQYVAAFSSYLSPSAAQLLREIAAPAFQNGYGIWKNIQVEQINLAGLEKLIAVRD